MNPNIQEIISLLKEGYTEKTIVQRLIRKGVSETEIPALYTEAYALYLKQSKKKVRIIYGSITVFLFLLVFLLLPITISGNYPILIAIFMSIAIFWTGFSFIVAFPDSEHRLRFFSETLAKTHAAIVVLIPIAPIVIFSIIFANYFYWEVENEIQKHGVTVDAYIGDGNAITTQTTRRFTTHTTTDYTLKISFTTKTGRDLYLEKEVTPTIFNSVYQGMKTKVRYSKKHPEFFNLLYTPEVPTEAERTLQILKELNSMQK